MGVGTIMSQVIVTVMILTHLNKLIHKMKMKSSMLNKSFLVQAFKDRKYFNIPLILSIFPLCNLTAKAIILS